MNTKIIHSTFQVKFPANRGLICLVILHACIRVYFNVQLYTKCAVLNPFVQFLKHKCAVTKQTKIALIKTVFSCIRYPYKWMLQKMP
jgi:hypothetical protein